MTDVVIDGGGLSIDDIVAVARDGARAVLSDRARAAMQASRDIVDELASSGRPVYGVSTGFGSLADVYVEPASRARLQAALIRSHAAGLGEPVEAEVVRAMMLLRARTLAMAHSGARPLVADRLLDLLGADITPRVPEHGSLGCSGDLAPLAHVALVLLGEGEVVVGGECVDARDPAGASGRRAGGPRGKGGLGPRQRHGRDARDAGARLSRRPHSSRRGRHHRGDERRGAARHRRGVRARDPRPPTSSRPGRQRREPAPVARRITDRRVAPRGRLTGAGCVLVALRTPSARRGERRARRTSRASCSASSLRRSTTPSCSTTAGSRRTATSTALRWPTRRTSSRSCSPTSARWRSDGSTVCSTPRGRTACPRSSPTSRASTRG